MTLPSGPGVVFLFTDIEGSTRSERAIGSSAWAAVVERHDELLRGAIEAAGGVVVKTEGDAFFAAFDDPVRALAGAVAAARGVASEEWPGDLSVRVRMGVHLGEGRLRTRSKPDDPEDYVGIDVNYAARISAAANGGQIVASDAVTRAIVAAGHTLADLAAVDGLDGVSIVGAGLRAVKDFEDPAPLHLVVVPGVADDPRPLRTLDVPTNLPGDVTDLVGREPEIVVVRESLTQARIVTLVGPGGSGKTRLALAVARGILGDHPHGTWFVDLSAVRDASLIEPAIAVAIGLRESPERTMAEALAAHLRDRSILLVLDNLEQLLPDGAAVVARLVRGAPGLRVLVTSRELLRVAGEHGFSVPPLGLEEGVALFLDRARAQRPDLALTPDALAAVQAICERLGGLPLGIELAAARMRLLGPTAILDRLDRSLDLAGGPRDVPERQRTLRGTMAWSHELLPEAERLLFARLGVFASGWTVEAVTAVADPDGDLGADPLEALASLADKSLVRIDREAPDDEPAGEAARFSMHPLIREYALERLVESGSAPEIELRFAAYVATLAEGSGTAILTPRGEAVLRVLDHEDRNIRAALDIAVARGEPELGLRIMGATWRWFQHRGRIREARALLAGLLAPAPRVDIRVRIAALAAEGGLAYWMNEFDAADLAYDERLRLAEETGDPRLRADAHYDSGFMAMVAADEDSLRKHEETALELYVGLGDEDAAIRARQALVLAVFLSGDYERALDLENVNLAAFREKGSLFQVADSVTLLSAVHWRLGDPRAAWDLIVEGLQAFSRIEGLSGIVRNIGMAAIVLLADSDDPERGARVAGAAYKLVREQGAMLAPVKVLHLPDPLDLATDLLGPDRTATLIAEGESMRLDDVIAGILADAPPRLGAAREAVAGRPASP